MAMLLVLVLLLAGTKGRAEKCERQIELRDLNTTKSIGIFSEPTWNFCRWILYSPQDTRITVSCHYPYNSQDDNCSNQKISISRKGDMRLEDETHHCIPQDLNELSVENQMVVSLGIGNILDGYIKCTIGLTEKADPCNCGRRNTARIVGGVDTGINEFPMMAAIVKYSTNVIICGATIVSEKYSLTAAHCVGKGPPQDLGLLVGEHDHMKDNETSSTRTLMIDRVIAHAGYNKNEHHEKDIALVHTSDYILFNRNLGPVCLPFRHRDQLFVKETVTALGWGQTDIFVPLPQASNALQKAEFTVLGDEACNSPDALCMLHKGRGICDRDPGGPVLWHDPSSLKLLLVGIQSYATGCGEIDNINTRVTSYLDWIEKNAADASFCKYY